MRRKKGTTSRSEYFNLVDKTAGTAKTGITITQLLIGYVREGQGPVTTVASALPNTSAAYSANGAIEIDATNLPGLYRADIPDAAYSSTTGVDGVIVSLTAATTTLSVAPAFLAIDLELNTSSDTYSLVNAGVKALTVVGNVGGAVGSVIGNVGGSVASVVGNVGGNVSGSVASVIGNVGGSVASVVGNVGGSVGSVLASVLANSVTGNVGGSVGSVLGNLGGNVVGSVGSVVGNVGGSVDGGVAGVTATVVAHVSSNGDKTGYSTNDWTTALAESYRANGATGTPAQLLYELLAHHAEKTVSGVTMTLKKLDHSAVAATLTLDATTPSSVSRAT